MVIMLLLAACSPGSNNAASHNETQAEWVHFELETVSIRLQQPANWTAYTNSEYVILSEHNHAIQENGALAGIVAQFWTPKVTDFEWEHQAEANAAWEILRAVVHKPQLVGGAAHTEPVPFKWDGHDAAYYLLNSGDGNRSLVLLLMLPDEQTILAGRISTALQEAHRIREVLPLIFEHVEVNDKRLNSRVLNDLPDNFTFPIYPTPNVVRD